MIHPASTVGIGVSRPASHSTQVDADEAALAYAIAGDEALRDVAADRLFGDAVACGCGKCGYQFAGHGKTTPFKGLFSVLPSTDGTFVSHAVFGCRNITLQERTPNQRLV